LEYPVKTTDLPQVTDKLYYMIMLYQVHLAMSRIRTHNLSDVFWIRLKRQAFKDDEQKVMII